MLALFVLPAPRAFAQWMTQTITLRPGWNSIHLQVQPEPRDCDTVFAGLPIESAWGWNRRFSPIQFLQNPSELLPRDPDWLTWLPTSSPIASDNNLFALEGGKSYLIKLAGTAIINWNLRGIASARRPAWVPDSLNLVGFGVNGAAPPSFRSFFQYSAAHSNSSIYRLAANGNWVTNSPTASMQDGEAFWIFSAGSSDYSGPVRVSSEQRDGLNYGRILQEQSLRIRNTSTVPRTITIRQIAAEAAGSTNAPSRAGGVELSYWQNDYDGQRIGWSNLPPVLVYSNLPPGSEAVLRLAVRRADMPLVALPPGVSEVNFQSILEIIDSAGVFRCRIPVTAEGRQNYSQPAISGAGGGRFSAASAPSSIHPRAGLWVGSATISQVSYPAGGTGPAPTATDFEFRLIVHVNATGQPRLLQKVVQMFKNEVTNSLGETIDSARFVLLTDESLIPQYTGATLRDDSPAGRRVSSAAFGFPVPIPMKLSGGEFGGFNSQAECWITNRHDSPVSPFVHRYHPDHNNLSDRTDATGQLTPLPETNDGRGPATAESWTVSRQVTLLFASRPPDNVALAGWGDNQLGGTYAEQLIGLHKDAVTVRGTFRLHHASRVPLLNDQN